MKPGALMGIFMPIFVLMVAFSNTVFADANTIVKDAKKLIRTAERNMYSGKNTEADTMLKEALTMLEKAKAEEPDNKLLRRVEKKYQQTRAKVDKKINSSTSRSSSTSSSQIVNINKKATKKLPGGVKKRLNDINRLLDLVERGSTYKLDEANELFSEIDRMYGNKFDPNDELYVTTKNRFNQLSGKADGQAASKAQAEADAQLAKKAMEQQSAEWISQFQAYLSYPGNEGHNPDKLVFIPGTSETDKFADAQKRYEEFKQFYAQYKNTSFPNEKNWKLEELADRKAPTRLSDFETQFASRMGAVAERTSSQISQAMNNLNKDISWQSDKKAIPPLVDHKWMNSIEDSVNEALNAVGSNSPEGKKLSREFEELVKKDNQYREIRKQRTFMTPDKYTDSDIENIKTKASSLVKNNKKEGGQPLRTTVISSDWKEESVWEWTDTSRSQRRYRTTRSLTAQVAAKTKDGVRLITVAIAKDKQSDGSWGALYGNLHQYSEPMLEENVNT